MKIGFVFDDSLDKVDGVQQYVLAVGEWLRRQGHDVHYLVGETKRADIPNMHSLTRNISVRFNGNRMSIPLPAKSSMLRRFLAEEQFDVLHVQVPYSPWLAHKIIRLSPRRTAIVGTFHIMPQSGLVQLASRGLGLWLRSTRTRFGKMFAVSEAARRFATDIFGYKDVRVVPNVVDVPRFATAQPFERYADDVPTIMFLGRLVPRKGCMTLLEAAKVLHERGWTFRVVVCGKGPLATELQAYVARHNLASQVEFTGFIEEADKSRYVASADIMAFPSTGGESFGIVLIEAMAAGRPIVLAGDNEGYRSVLHERPELLFDPHDSGELAALLEKYLQKKPLAEEVLHWQKHYVAQFDIPVVGQQLLAAYRDLLQTASKP